MGMMFLPFARYSDFGGRSRRLEYGMFAILVIVASLALTLMDMAVGTFSSSSQIGLFSGIFTLAIIVPSIALGVRRLHDFGKSGWWYLVILVPVINIIFGLVLLFVPGNVGPNRFGPDPKGMPRPA